MCIFFNYSYYSRPRDIIQTSQVSLLQLLEEEKIIR